MKKFIYLILLPILVNWTNNLLSQCPDKCNAVLLLGFNEFGIYTQNDLESAYSEMLSKSDLELDEISRQSNSNSGLSANYKAIGSSWSKNKNNLEWRNKFNEAREEYKSSGILNTGFLSYSNSRTVNDETIEKWKDCKNRLYDCLENLEKTKRFLNQSITTQIVGNEFKEFILVLHFKPINFNENKPIKISSVSLSSNILLGEPKTIISGNEIIPFTGISQMVRRTNSESGSITINLDGYSPIILELPAEIKSSSVIPIGTIISSSLSYSELCMTIGEGTIFSVNNTWAPADGRSVQGSAYGNLKVNVPDLRGVFIRGLNQFYPDNNGSGLLNYSQLDKDHRSPGHIQYWSTGLPRKEFTGITLNGGNHSHRFLQYIVGGDSHSQIAFAARNQYSANRYERPRNTDPSGEHNHKLKIDSGGDNETRPTNVSYYYYIKIN